MSCARLPLLPFFLLSLLAVRGIGASASRPNLVLIMADDQGIGEVGCYGAKVIPTPNIDRLAAEGMKFTRAYSGSAVCAPTRAVLMTGLHTGHATRRNNMSKDGLIPLRADDITVAQKLKESGYATGGFGKWGLGNPGTTGIPEKHGFDLWYGYYDQVHAHSYFPTYLVRNSVEEKNLLKVAHAQRAFQQQIEDPEPRPVAEAFVDSYQLHGPNHTPAGIFSKENVDAGAQISSSAYPRKNTP